MEKGVRMVLAGEMRAVREDKKETREPAETWGRAVQAEVAASCKGLRLDCARGETSVAAKL